jgi:hypothetical protein
MIDLRSTGAGIMVPGKKSQENARDRKRFARAAVLTLLTPLLSSDFITRSAVRGTV